MKIKFLLLALLAFGSYNIQAQCVASFSSTANPNGTYTYTATGSVAPFIIYTWSFGNGASGTGQTVTTSYNAPGNYTVCMYLNDTLNNCTDSSCTTITYTGGVVLGCTASYTSSVSGNNVALTSTSTAVNAMTYSWSDGSGVFATTANATYTNAPGTYNICLLINDATANCTDSFCSLITIPNTTPCQAGFYIFPDSNGPAHTYIGVNTSVGANLAYNWSWGDGSSSTGQNPSHTYPAAGNYQICLYVSAPGTNCVDSFCAPYTINKTTAMYTVNFGAAPTNSANVNTISNSLYPNPATNYFIVKGADGQKMNVDFYTISGTKMKSINITTNQQVDISSLPTSIYLVKITNAAGLSEYVKFVKQ